MRFRPCIDIHNGRVKQIVGGTLCDSTHEAKENFVSEYHADFYAEQYRGRDLPGGHIILLNPRGTEEYQADIVEAERALAAYPNGLQIGGGICTENASRFLDAGASHVIVTSYVFSDGLIQYDKLNRLVSEVGKEHLVLDLSCRKREEDYYIVTNRWQTYTDVKVTKETLQELSSYCDEFLIHAVDVEGKCRGIEKPLVDLLGSWGAIPITYAGGVAGYEDLKILKELGRNRLDVTIGSALDLFGGTMEFERVVEFCKKNKF
ncbi:MAG: phosphoribosylformimino-5-aminoimidazole carboxamide ribotide isomerase [Lachnospiraceae bacterium]